MPVVCETRGLSRPALWAPGASLESGGPPCLGLHAARARPGSESAPQRLRTSLKPHHQAAINLPKHTQTDPQYP
jgi:hypothetical protein